tara:strand:- start:774 stop:1367 length:594 start_codon:yes stop_codon:yes gene_type:complete
MSNYQYYTEIQTTLENQIPGIARNQVQKLFRAAFQKKKNRMISEFLNHPVTKEIDMGINAKNISGTLGGGSGNLFSFIGFDAGYDPIEPIEEVLLRADFKLVKVTRRTIEFSIFIPEPRDIFAVTPMPWASGRSWAKGIETGISGLGYYLLKPTDASRSGLGVQSPRKIRKKSRFKNTQYITAFIKKYEKEFSNLAL